MQKCVSESHKIAVRGESVEHCDAVRGKAGARSGGGWGAGGRLVLGEREEGQFAVGDAVISRRRPMRIEAQWRAQWACRTSGREASAA